MEIRKKAYTLTEIVLAVMIIGLIFSIVSVSLSEIRRSSRDTRRISDIAQIQLALEEYYRDEGTYPDLLTPGEDLVGSTGKTYLIKIPQNPQPTNNKCDLLEYQYTKYENKNSYFLDFCLEKDNKDFSQGINCLSPISNQSKSPNCFECGQNFLDIRSGNEYKTVGIGEQCWFAENLKETKYNDKTNIEYPGTNNTEWAYNTNGAYAWYNNQEEVYRDTRGALYNWQAVNTNKLCPLGWHVPSDEEWKILEGSVDSTYGIDDPMWNNTSYIGDDVGSKLSGQYDLWNDGVLRNHINFSQSNFNAIPSGLRNDQGDYSYTSNSYFWSSSESGTGTSWRRYIDPSYTGTNRLAYNKSVGFSVRCLKDN